MDLAEIARLFDARAKRYMHDEWHRRYAEVFVAAVPLRTGDFVLDAGTGTGFAACAIARRVGPSGRVLGVDLSAAMLDAARAAMSTQCLENIELLRADVTELAQIQSATFDAIVCSAGLLYMPVAKALREWHRLLKPAGIVAFSTMRVGSPTAKRVFRECAAEYGLILDDASEPLGTEDRCRHALARGGFDPLNVIAAQVDFERLDPVTAWEANFCSAGHAAVRSLAPELQEKLRQRYLDVLQHAMDTDPTATSRADVLFAIGRRTDPAAGD